MANDPSGIKRPAEWLPGQKNPWNLQTVSETFQDANLVELENVKLESVPLSELGTGTDGQIPVADEDGFWRAVKGIPAVRVGARDNPIHVFDLQAAGVEGWFTGLPSGNITGQLGIVGLTLNALGSGTVRHGFILADENKLRWALSLDSNVTSGSPDLMIYDEVFGRPIMRITPASGSTRVMFGPHLPLSPSGQAHFFTIGGGLYASGATLIGDQLAVSGFTRFLNSVSVAQNVGVTGQLYVVGDIRTEGNLAIGDAAEFAEEGGIDARLDVGAGTTALSQVHLHPSPAPTNPASGSMFYGSDGRFYGVPGTALRVFSFSSNHVTGTIYASGTTNETTLFSTPIESPLLFPGRTFIAKLYGDQEVAAPGTDEMTTRAKIGNFTIASFTNNGGVTTPNPYAVELIITCRSIAASGEFFGTVVAHYPTSTTAWAGTITTTTSPVYVPLAQITNINITAQWGVASVDNVLRIFQGWFEIKN